MSRFCIIFLCSVFAAVSFTGCNSPNVSVSGKVTFDGVPGENIAVLFQPKSEGGAALPSAAFGLTNKKGEYSLSLLQNKRSGVVPGEYSVYLSWKNPAQEAVNFADTEAKHPDLCPYKIPARATTGEMMFTVPENGTKTADFDFDSSSEKPAKSSGI